MSEFLKQSLAADIESLRQEFEQKTKALVEKYNAKIEELTRPKLAGIKSLLSEPSEPSDSSCELSPIQEASPLIANPAPESEDPRKRRECPYKGCPYRSFDSSDVGRHINDRHELMRIYVCPICGFCAKQSTNVKTHSAKAHSASLFFLNHVNRHIIRNDKKINVNIGEVRLNDLQKALWGDKVLEVLGEEQLLEKARNFSPSYRS